MEANQNQRVVKPKRINMDPQRNTELDGGRKNTRDFAQTSPHQGKSNFKPKEGKARYHDLVKEVEALKVQLEDSQFQEHKFHCKYAAAERKAQYLKVQLDEAQSKFKYSTAAAEATINELKEHLERARSNEMKSCEEEIQELKFELREAGFARISNANRLLLADKIMASQSAKLDEAKKKLQQQNDNPAVQPYEEASKIDLPDLNSGNEVEAPSKNQNCREEPDHNKQPEDTVEKLQELLLAVQKQLEQQAAKHREEQQVLHCEIEDLKAKLCTNEVQNPEASYHAQLEDQREENIKLMAALKSAEEEKASLLQTLQDKEVEWSQRETTMGTRLDDLESMMQEVLDKKSKNKKRCWLVRLFSRMTTTRRQRTECVF